MYSNDAFGVPVLCLLTLITGGETTHATEGPLRIGLIASNGAGTDALAAGARAAVEEVNASGGIGGRPLQLVRAAPGHPWRAGAGRLADLVFDGDLIAVIGPQDGTTAHTVAQIATRRRIPVLTLSPEDSLTRALDPWVLRGVPDDGTQARTLLRWARAGGVGERLGLAVPTGRAGRERSDSLRRAAEETDTRVACVMQLDAAAIAASPEAAFCDAADYDVLMLWLDPGPALELLAALDPNRLPERILGSTRLDEEIFARGLRDLADSMAAGPAVGFAGRLGRLAIPLLRPSDRNERCAPAAEATLAERLGHDLVRAVADAARRAGTDALSIRDALRDGASLEGRSGRFGFDSNGNRTEDLRVGLWRREGWVPAPTTHLPGRTP